MKIRRALFNIFGPVILAAVLVFVILVIPYGSHGYSSQTVEKAALSQSKNIFKGSAVKEQAMDGNYVPFFGSSELSRMDAFHPASLAKHYHRNYRPFLLGAAGSQSLAHYWGMQGINAQLDDKKAVMIVSPQWFVKKGQNPAAFGMYYSNLDCVNWLLNAKDTRMDRYAAKRLLQMPSAKSSVFLERLIKKVARGEKLTSADRLFLKAKKNSLINEDRWFSTLTMHNRIQRIDKVAASLPAGYNYKTLDHIAYKHGEKHTKNNPFRVSDKFWNKKLKRRYKSLKGSQEKFNYVKSPEFSDFELVLNQFQQNNMNVVFVIPPVNKQWSNYTGLSMPMLRQFDRKINYQLRSQGFNNIVDMSQDGGEKYFMQDTIHLGWRGWLKMDQTVGPFLQNKQAKPNYKINNYFYTTNWQNLSGKKLSDKVGNK